MSLLYSVNLTEYVVIDPRVSVCLSVCLCVCLSVSSLQPKRVRLGQSHGRNFAPIFFNILEHGRTRTFTPRKYVSRACLSQMDIFIVPKVICCRM